MKNLKRFLSLALSGVMLVGMMAMGASAAEAKDFTDADEIQNKQAVTTMASLNVINGKDTGAFDPEGIVTRAEMAKMITVMMNGGKEPVLPVKSTPTYTDIGGHWAEKYIEYCSSQGIIAGRGDGTFAPDETVTASQAAKMALVALGYDSNVFNFTGIDWEVNVNSYASAPDADLYDDFVGGYDPSQGMKRDDAALLLYNTLDAKVMSKSYDTIVSNGEVTQKYSLSSEHFIEDRFNAVKVEGVVIANEAANLTAIAEKGSSLDENRTRIAITNYNDDKDSASNDEQIVFDDDTPITVQATTGLAELGQKVTVYVKKNSTRNKAEIMGDVIVSTDNVIVTDYSADSIADVADDNGLGFTSTTQIAYDYRDVKAATSAQLNADSVRGLEKILIDCDDDGDVEYVLVNAYRFGKVSSYSASGDGSIQVNAGGKTFVADDKKDVVGFDDVAKNDYVMVNYIGGCVWVEKAETVTGEINAYKEDSAYIWQVDGTRTADKTSGLTVKMTVDDKDYNVSAVVGYENGADSIQRVYSTKYGRTSLGTAATFYMDKGGYIVAAGDVADTAYNYALVLGKDQGINEQVKVALSDGTKATYTVNTGVAGSSDVPYSQIMVGNVYAYNLTSTGKIRLSRAKQTLSFDDVAFTNGKTTVGSLEGLKEVTTDTAGDETSAAYAGTRFSAGTNTAFFYVSTATTLPYAKNSTTTLANDQVNIYTGYNKAVSLDSAKTIKGRIYRNNANNVVAVLFYGDDITKADVNNFVYINSVGMTNTDYTAVKAFVDGVEERQDIKIDGTDVTNRIVALYTINSNGYYELKAPAAANLKSGTVERVGTKSFVLNDGTEIKVNADTLLVDDSKYLDAAVARLGDRPEEHDVITYVLFDRDASGEADTAKLIVVRNEKQSSAEVEVDTDSTATGSYTKGFTLNYFGATAPSAGEVIALVKAADKNVASVTVPSDFDGASTGKDFVKVTLADGSELNVKALYQRKVVTTVDGSTVTANLNTAATQMVIEGLKKGANYIKVADSYTGETSPITVDADGKLTVTVTDEAEAKKGVVSAVKVTAGGSTKWYAKGKDAVVTVGAAAGEHYIDTTVASTKSATTAFDTVGSTTYTLTIPSIQKDTVLTQAYQVKIDGKVKGYYLENELVGDAGVSYIKAGDTNNFAAAVVNETSGNKLFKVTSTDADNDIVTAYKLTTGSNADIGGYFKEKDCSNKFADSADAYVAKDTTVYVQGKDENTTLTSTAVTLKLETAPVTSGSAAPGVWSFSMTKDMAYTDVAAQ